MAEPQREHLVSAPRILTLSGFDHPWGSILSKRLYEMRRIST